MHSSWSIRVRIARFLLGIVWLALFNSLPDAPGNSPDPLLNEMESLHEWVAEVLLDDEDAVAEQHERDTSLSACKKLPDFHTDGTLFALPFPELCPAHRALAKADGLLFRGLDVSLPPPDRMI